MNQSYLIRNYNELVKFHEENSARLVLSAIEIAVKSVKPEYLIGQAVQFDGKKLTLRDINGRVLNLIFDNLYLVGAGKATLGMAEALESILKEEIIAGGAITIPLGTKMKNHHKNTKFSITEASHPIPNEAGLEGTKSIIRILQMAEENDLVLVLISGGGSALMPLPAPGISLQDKQRATSLLLASGASIQEVNIVRKHLSSVKGGQLLRNINRPCKVVSLVISDVIGDDLASIASGPTYPDNSTFKDALKILKKYKLTEEIRAVTKHIIAGTKGEVKETPKADDPVFSNVNNFIIGNNSLACRTACSYLQEKGLKAVHLGSAFDGQARDLGTFMSRLASDLKVTDFALVAGGEATVKLNKIRNGIGGRNQEAALACANELDRTDIAIAFIGTDGIDGNSDAAGAIISQKIISHYRKSELQKYLRNHDSYNILRKMHSLIFTGYTGTNVNDIAIMVSSSTTKDIDQRRKHRSPNSSLHVLRSP